MDDAEQLPASVPRDWRRLVKGGAISAAVVLAIMTTWWSLLSLVPATNANDALLAITYMATAVFYLPMMVTEATNRMPTARDPAGLVGMFTLGGAFWFMIGVAVTAVTRRRGQAIVVWLGVYVVCGLVIILLSVVWHAIQP